MLHSFENLALLREIREVAGIEVEKQLRCKYKKELVMISRVAFLPRSLLGEALESQITNLDNYFLMAYLCKELGIHKDTFRDRIRIMQKQDVKFFDFKKIGGLYFIKVTDEQREWLKKYEAIKINKSDILENKNEKEWLRGVILFGDIGVVVY